MTAVEMLQGFRDGLEPPPDTLPSKFAEDHTWVNKGVTSNVPVPWDNSVFPFLAPIMDLIRTAILLGKRGVVIMKPGQAGGSSAMIRVWAWLAVTYGGPTLYLISKDDHARKFVRERFDYQCKSCEPLAKKWIRKRGAGNDTQNRVFLDGSLTVVGGGSNRNYESNPYRWVLVDEPDSVPPDMQGYGDPISLAEVRTDAFPGETLMIVFSHPTSKERGTGKLYYGSSDQARAFVDCPHCPGEFYLTWEHVKVCQEEGQTIDQAKRDPHCYHYFAPCCGAEISDAQRYELARNTRQQTTMTEEEAAKKDFLSAHFSHLYMVKPLARLATRYIEGLDDPSKMRVFYNKVLGEVYVEKTKETAVEDWQKLRVIPRFENDPNAYALGEVPPEVRFLTAGQDSRASELHWTVWGWGLVRTSSGLGLLCGWLIDYGVLKREPPRQILDAEDLEPLTQLLYDRAFPRSDIEDSSYKSVEVGFHDAGWQPRGVWEYAQGRPGVIVPCRGRSADEESPAPPLSWGPPLSWTHSKTAIKVKDDRLKEAILNTYKLKEAWFGLVDSDFEEAGTLLRRPRLHLPRDVGDDIIIQLSSEFLSTDGKKKKWKRRGENHWSDCSVYAYAAANNLTHFLRGKTREEAKERAQRVEEHRRQRRSRPPKKGGRGGVRRQY